MENSLCNYRYSENFCYLPYHIIMVTMTRSFIFCAAMDTQSCNSTLLNHLAKFKGFWKRVKDSDLASHWYAEPFNKCS